MVGVTCWYNSFNYLYVIVNTLRTRTLLCLEEGSANRTISGCLNRPDMVSVVAGGVISSAAMVVVVVVVGPGIPEGAPWPFAALGLVLKLHNTLNIIVKIKKMCRNYHWIYSCVVG